MGEPIDVFKARISAADDSSSVLNAIREHAKALGLEFDKTGKKLREVHNPGMWARMRESVHEAGEHFEGLGERIKGIGEHIGELVPAIGALGAAGSVWGVLEGINKVSESYSEMAHSAESLGMQAQELHRWNGVATLTDTNAEGMAKSMSRLNKVLAEVTHGKNKDAAALFHELKIDPRQFHNAAEALPALADAFHNTTNATMRTRMAFTLMGRQGTDMIPMMMRGSKGIKEVFEVVDRVQHDFSKGGKGLADYHESMAGLGLAAKGVADELADDLAPAFEPVLDHTRDWIAANRAWIGTKITDEVRDLSNWVEHTDWASVGREFGSWAHSAESLAEDFGGITSGIEILAGAAVAAKVAGIAGSFTTMAAGAAATAEALSGMAGVAAGLAIWSYKANSDAVADLQNRLQIEHANNEAGAAIRERFAHLSPAKQAEFRAMMQRQGSHVLDAPRNQYLHQFPDRQSIESGGGADDYAAIGSASIPSGGTVYDDRMRPVPSFHSFAHLGGFTPAPHQAGEAGAGARDGRVQVDVNFLNAPAGITVTAIGSGAVDPPKVHLGQAWPEHH